MNTEETTKEEPTAAAPVVAAERMFEQKDIDENKYVATLSYVSILFLVPLLLKKESPFAQFHAKQGLVVFLFWCVGWFVFWIPLLGWALAFILLVVNVMAIFRTLSGEAWEIPFVRDVVKKFNI